MKNLLCLSVICLFVLLWSGCSAADESIEDKNDVIEETEESNTNNVETDNQENKTDDGNNEESESKPNELTNEKAEEILLNLKQTFMVETTNDNIVINYDTVAELQQHFETVMSESLAERYLDGYFQKENENLKLLATEEPAWFQPEEDYSLEEENPTTYHLIQKQQSELHGNKEYTFTIKAREDTTWYVSNISSKDINQEFTEKDAIELVSEHLEGELGDNMALRFDRMEEGNYIIHVFENTETHTATYGWYEVNPETEEVTSMF
ncbi:hypothetical protein BN988_01399 [Oceanobacillus picturae]|uniref:Uncharacterized protein n=1 Tax=Oceanobacillus picturae TaxID=171693 RepID=W9AAZ6_9BACI|nr:hypothetical protein [Oceanobacillus picturae]CDO02919.1 hypothetical protein BN988_01399 [Oceanobacillus picturae]